MRFAAFRRVHLTATLAPMLAAMVTRRFCQYRSDEQCAGQGGQQGQYEG